MDIKLIFIKVLREEGFQIFRIRPYKRELLK